MVHLSDIKTAKFMKKEKVSNSRDVHKFCMDADIFTKHPMDYIHIDQMSKSYLLMPVLPNIFAGIFLYYTFFNNDCMLEQKPRDADIMPNGDNNRIVKTITEYFLR